jgi:hypothetical protein
VALDFRRRAWLTFTELGDFVNEVPYRDLSVGWFRMMAMDTLAVVGVFDGRPASAGYPLHVVNLRSGLPVAHFGATEGVWVRNASSQPPVIEEADRIRGSAVWWSPGTQPRFEQWSPDGLLLRAVQGELEWFSERPSGGRSPPPAWVMAFAVDAADRLWLMTRVPDPRWRSVPLQGPESGVTREQLDAYFDARLDVFDLRSKRHLGSHTWDMATMYRLVSRGREVLVSALEYQSPLWPRIVLYAVVIP